MNLPRILALTFCAAAIAPAQSFVTSPRGYDAVEGNTTFNHFPSSADRRFHQVDATHVGSVFLVQSLGLRRDGGTNGGGTGAGPRTTDFEVTMGLANFGVLSRVFDNNFKAGSRQIVYTNKPTNMPSWIGNAGIPAPFDFVVPLDVPFFYVGVDALVIDFSHRNLTYTGGIGSAGGSAIDRSYVGALTSTGAQLGIGCSGSGVFAQTMRLENNGPGAPNQGMRMRISATGGPLNSPAILNMDFVDANLTIPGLCGTLNALPVISFGFGVTDAAGVIPETSVSFPYSASLIGAQLVTQLLAIDIFLPAIPIAVSNGRLARFPNDPTSLSQACLYGWSTLPTDQGTLFFGGGVVMQLGI